MSNEILPRNNWYDGQQITETDMDVEQQAWHSGIAQIADHISGSGIERDTAVQVVLFDTDDVPASIQSLLNTQNFDGEPIYPEDAFGNTVYVQPSNSSEGNQLEIEISESDLLGSAVTKVFLFGLGFNGDFIEEVLVFDDNGSQITKKHFTKLVAIMTQDFRGNQNTIVDGTASRNFNGRLRILEALPMTLTIDPIMAEQSVEPNMDYRNFKPATLSKTLDILLDEIADTENLNADDLDINTTSTTTRELPPNTAGLIVGQKFQATTNNIQKISLLLSVKENTLAVPGEEFDWSGTLIVEVRALQTTATCPTDTIPGTAIEFDPEPSSLAEVSFNQADLAELGISLNEDPQIVDFIFTQSLLANPNIEPSIEPGKYYVVAIRRAGDISNGTIILQEAANTDSGTDVVDNTRMTVFLGNKWTDVPESDMWFKIYTDALRVVDGTAFDDGVQITIPKIKENTTTGIDESFIEGHHSFIDVSYNIKNYAIVQKANNFTDPKPHPATGNLVFTRIEDAPSISIVSEDTLSTLLDAGNETIILGYARDINPVSNPEITGTLQFPGLVSGNKFTVINPNSDVLINNLVGSILVPNTEEPELKYRIVKVEIFNDAYGDVNNDGIIDLDDVLRAQALDGYAKDLVSGTVPSAEQIEAIESGEVTIEEIIRADVNGDGVIDIIDSQLIQQNIALGTAFSVGSSFKRVVITVENLIDPLGSTADIVAADNSFNDIPFSSIDFRIDFVPLWTPSNLLITDLRRFIPKTFTSVLSDNLPDSGGSNTSYMPGDVIIGGNILNTDGEPYSIDLEVNSIIIDLPEGSTQGEIDVFNSFVKNKMKFADGTFVSANAINDNQIKIIASIQSAVKDLDGYDFDSIDGNDPIDETISILYTQSSGILRIRANNIRNISTRTELKTKIALTVYLKKAGFQNSEVSVSSDQVNELLTPV